METPRSYEEFCAHFVHKAPVATTQGERIYLESDALTGFKTAEQRKPYSRGLPLGTRSPRGFTPSLALLRLLAERSEMKITVPDARAQWLFLCGRDLFPESFTTTHGPGLFLVQNERNENLGLGELTPSDKGLYLRNIVDLGNFLRHEAISLEAKTPRRKTGRNGKPMLRR